MRNFKKFFISFMIKSASTGYVKTRLMRYGYSITDSKSFMKAYEFVNLVKKSGISLNVIYDIGANKGLWTEEVRTRCSPDLTFILFEANKIYNDQLAKINFPFFNVLLSDRAEEAHFFSVNGTGDSMFRELTNKYKTVEPILSNTSTLDSFARENALPLPELIKLDTQGSELLILKGSREILKTVKFIIAECSIVPYNSGAPIFSETIDFLQSENFHPYAIAEFHKNNKKLFQMDIIFVSHSTIELLP